MYSKVRPTIWAVVLLVNPLPPSEITKLVGLNPRVVAQLLNLVQSPLPFDEDFDQPIKCFHKFPDFITDPSLCTDTRFCISPQNLHLELAMNFLRIANDGLEQDLPDYALNSEARGLQTRIYNFAPRGEVMVS